MSDHQVLEGRRRAGSLLAGRYELRSLLGQGGMAEVYLGIDRLLGRDVAVKVMWEGLARDDRFLARFRREARAAAALNHPGIVAVHDTGTHEGTPFIVMELVRGRSLSEVIWAEAPLAPSRSAEIAESVADALAFAHDAGIVHRDVKPANIMLTPTGAVKVLDFGIARAAAWTPLTAAAAGHGTPEYVSPEQARGEDSDGRSDIYSLGAVLFEMVTGRPPFTGESPLVVAYRHVREPAATPSSINRAVPPALDSIIMRCLAKAPEHRYQRASQLRQDLRRLADHAPSATLAVSRPPRLRTQELEDLEAPTAGRAARHRRWPMAALAILGVTALIATAGLVLARAGGTPGAVPTPPVTTTAAPPPLYAPAILHASTGCTGFLEAEVVLRWSVSISTFADGYEVYRSTSKEGPFQMVGLVLGRSERRYTDGGLDQNTSYHYVVRATGEGRSSVDAARADVDTPFFCAW